MCDAISQPHTHHEAEYHCLCDECEQPIAPGDKVISLHLDELLVHEFHKDEEC